MDATTIVDREVRIAAPPDIVASFFTDPAKVVTWMASRARVEPRPRGMFRFEFDRPDGSTDVAVGEFVEVTPRRIVFTWGFEGRHDLRPGTTRVEVTLEPDGDGTRLRLQHFDLPTADLEAHAGGWSLFLDRLAQVARVT